MVDILAHVPRCTIAPPLRCYHRTGNSLQPFCGHAASWMRPGRDWFSVEYFCNLHHETCDVAIPAEHAFRRVRLTVDVLLAGVSINSPIAQGEAVAQLEAAVQSIGGVLDVSRVLSTVVCSSPGLGPGVPSDALRVRE